MCKNKAKGLDDLPDWVIRDKKIWEKIKPKLLQQFNKWLNGARVPRYLKSARIYPISKDKEGSQYPEEG